MKSPKEREKKNWQKQEEVELAKIIKSKKILKKIKKIKSFFNQDSENERKQKSKSYPE